MFGIGGILSFWKWMLANINLCLKLFNTLTPRQDGRYFTDDVLKCIFLNENQNVWISLKIPLKFVPRGPINNIPALVQIMALVPTRRQAIIWTNVGICTDAYMRHSASMS